VSISPAKAATVNIVFRFIVFLLGLLANMAAIRAQCKVDFRG
jgi:hypothetical protein